MSCWGIAFAVLFGSLIGGLIGDLGVGLDGLIVLVVLNTVFAVLAFADGRAAIKFFRGPRLRLF